MKASECEYCSPTSGRALDPAFLASTMHGAANDIESAVANLAEMLEKSFPDHTTVESSGGMLSAKKIKLLEVNLEPNIFRLRRDGKHLVAERVKIVRGVALKTSKLKFDEWIKEVARDLSAIAKETASSRAALARFVRGQ
jgi:hypothetical protein